MNEIVVYGESLDAVQVQYELLVPNKLLPAPIASAAEYDGNDPHAFGAFDESVACEFDESVPKAEREDYLIAAISGALTGTLSAFWSKEFSLEQAHEWGSEKVNDFVIEAAKTAQKRVKDPKLQKKTIKTLSDAVDFLETWAVNPNDRVKDPLGGGLYHHLRDFTHHPTPFGLLCSILSEFTEHGYGTDVNGNFIKPEFPEGTPVGETFEEKIFIGTIKWFFHLASDMAGSSNNPGEGTGIPGPLLAFLKELSTLPIFKKNVGDNPKDHEKTFSVWITHLFRGVEFKDKDGNPVIFDLRTEMGIVGYALDQAKPVIINECLVRCAYTARRIYQEVKANEIRSFGDLARIKPERILPINNRILARMITVSTGIFVLVNGSAALIKAAQKTKKSDGGKGDLLINFALNVNFVGIARFGIACAMDAAYIIEDAKDVFKNLVNRDKAQEEMVISSLSLFSLTAERARILHSLEAAVVDCDMNASSDADELKLKSEWKELWTKALFEVVEQEESYILDEDSLYDMLFEETDGGQDIGWLILIALELALFRPYTPLGCEQDKQFKKLKIRHDYIKEDFCSKQVYVGPDKVKSLDKSYRKYSGMLSGSTTRKTVGAVVTIGVTAASAGVALAFAPAIAAALAGEAVAGLSGAALANASLAFIGGGSLAAGGLGVAGGTAILTGGGALVGLAGSGTFSALNVLLSSSDEYILYECSKILAICSDSLSENLCTNEEVLTIASLLESQEEEMTAQIEKLEEQEQKPDKKEIKRMKKSAKYLKSCSAELRKLVDKRFGKQKELALPEGE